MSRLTTRPIVLPRPLEPSQAFALVDEWLEQPPSVIVQPSDGHRAILRELIEPLGTGGNLTTDAHLAALAIERNAVLCSTDGDFRRFAGVRFENPIA